jgi:transcriptional regulator with XRE-family HTH domain
MNSQSSLVNELRDKAYRHAFVKSQLRIGLPMMCRALREDRGWTQPELAKEAGMSQPRISEIERPGERNLNLETLLRLAEAYDVALQVRFVPFRTFVDDSDSISLHQYSVKPFEKDLMDLEAEELWGRAQARRREMLTLKGHPIEKAQNPNVAPNPLGNLVEMPLSKDPQPASGAMKMMEAAVAG